MNDRKRVMLLLWGVMLMLLSLHIIPVQTALAESRQAQADPNVSIQYPPPIYVVSGALTVRGSANLANMSSYFLEYRRLIDVATPQADGAPWLPATLPSRSPVLNGVLGVWNTTTLDDGLYELRLTVLVTGGQPVYARVSPLRVENQPPPFAVTPTPTTAPIVVLTEPPPTLLPPSTPVPLTPEVTALTDANVRSGDSVRFAEVGYLLRGQSARIVGVSSTGSGWWLIVLANGRSGWIAPSTVQVSGDLSSVPIIAPPPPPTLTPTPIPTVTPITLPDAVITNVHFDRAPQEDKPFHVIVTVNNQSSVRLPRVSVSCNFTPGNDFYNRFLNNLPPYGVRDVTFNVRLRSGGGSNVTANCAVDVNNLVPELNEYNNYYNLTTMLAAP